MKQAQEIFSRRPSQMFASSLANGLQLLDAFRPFELALSHGELVQRSSLSKATVSRLAHTLCDKGFLQYDVRARRYRLGARMLTISNPLMAELRVRQAARPLMRTLADEFLGSVSLGMRDRGYMVYIETIRGHESPSFRPEIGGSTPMWNTAMGRAWIADRIGASPKAEWPDILQLSGLRDARDNMPIIEEAMDDYLRHGFCCSRGYWIPTVYGAAVPVRLPLYGETLVFNVGIPAARIEPEALEREVGPRLKQMVCRLKESVETWTGPGN